MSASAFIHFVFVDFENVSELDLGLLEGRPVHVTLMLGKAQTRLDLVLVEQIHRAASQVSLVRLAGSGRNALDLTLSCYLGKAVQQWPEAQFSVLSGDKDFDPLIEHLLAAGVKVLRCERFKDLPFFPRARKSTAKKSLAGVSSHVSNSSLQSPQPLPALPPTAVEARMDKLCRRLKDNLCPRPRTLTRLLSHVGTCFGAKLSESELLAKIEELKQRGVLSVDGQGKVTY